MSGTMKYVLTAKGYYFGSKIDLDETRLAEGTQTFNTANALYDALAKRYDMTAEEFVGGEYTIVSRTEYSCDRGFVEDFNFWDNAEMPTPEQFLNDFVL